MTRKRKKVLFLSAGAIALAVFAVTFVLLLNIQAFKPRIEAAASNATGMDVRIRGRIGIVFVPGFGISVKGVSVRNRGVDVVTIEKMRIGLKLIPLLRREVQASWIELVKPVFSIVRYKSGRFNFEKPGRTLSEKLLAITKSSISQGNLVFTDEISAEKIEAQGFALTIKSFTYGGTDNADSFKNISFTGDIGCKTLKINNFTLTNLVMTTAGEKGIFNINPLRMHIFGGTGSGSIHGDATGTSPHYRVSYTLSQCKVDELIQAFSPKKIPRKSIEGLADFFADVTAKGKSVAEVKQSLSGDVSLKGDNLVLYSIDIDALIPKYERSQNFNLVDVGAFFLVGPFGPVITKSYNFGSLYEEMQGGKGIIRKLVSIWKIKNGIAEAIDAAIATKKYRIAMKGGLDFNDDRFVNVTVAVLDKRGCPVYSQKVHGPFRKPKIEKVSIVKSITGPLSNALKDAWKIIGGACKVFYSGSVAQPEG